MDPEIREDETAEPLTERGREAMTGLRAIWAATGQIQAGDLGLECAPNEAGCTASVGFDGLADTGEATDNRGEAIDRLRRAWKTTLAREGKLYEGEEQRAGPPAPDPAARPEGGGPE